MMQLAVVQLLQLGPWIVTVAVVENAGQEPLAGIVYVTVYVPVELVLGVMAPVLVFNVNPLGVDE